jgi:hypothetical protein
MKLVEKNFVTFSGARADEVVAGPVTVQGNSHLFKQPVQITHKI